MTHLVPVLRPVLGTPFRRATLYRKAGELPSFHINPASLGHARDLITGNLLGTYNSASPAWAVGPGGILALPAANAPVLEYDPVTLACLGARIWGSVTNQIRNNTGQGAVAGAPGTAPTNWSAAGVIVGLSRQIVGAGIIDGIDYVDIRYFGTATGSAAVPIQPEASTAVVAAPGQSWTASSWLAIVGGSTGGTTSVAQRITGRTSTGTFVENTDTVLTPTPLLVRYSASRTMAGGTVARVTNDIIFSFNSGAVIDITLRIGLPQLEQSAVMGPVVKTAGTTASSTADVWDITSLAGGINNIRTVYARVRTPASGIRGIISLNDNSSSNRLELLTNGTDPRAVAVTSGSTVADINGGTIAANTTFRIAARFDGDNYAVSINGAPVVTDNAGARAIVDRIFLGRTQAGEYLNGIIEELATWTQPLGNSQLQAVTS